MSTEAAILIGAALATLGWLYTGRKARTLSRKQHTINIMVQASFNKEFREAFALIAPQIRAKQCIDFNDKNHEALVDAYRRVLNHYEFMAAGLRNGDLDEALLRDSERGTILNLIETCQENIFKLRTSRRRQSIYEHLEWLYRRWESNPPGRVARCWEYFLNKPIAGPRVKVKD
jgi:hypothetical protein